MNKQQLNNYIQVLEEMKIIKTVFFNCFNRGL